VFIIRALREASWQRTKAAELLGITRATLHAKIKRYDIKIPGSRTAFTDEPALSDSLPAEQGL
jgi:DNA-binding NtrC family response regulator